MNNRRIKLTPQKYFANFELSKFLEQSIPVLIGIFIFFNPFPHTTSIKEICYYLSIFVIVILILFKKIDFTFKTPLLLPFGLFILWSFLSIFFAIDKQNSIHDFYSHLIRYVILYFIIINFFNSKKNLVYLSRIIIISSNIFIIGGLFYYYLILQGKPHRFGVFTQASVNIVGVIAVFAFILALNHFRNEKHLYFRVFWAFSLLVLFIGLLMTKTRSIFIAILLSTIFFFYNNKKIMFIFLILMLLIYAISPAKNRYQFHNPRKMFTKLREDVRTKIDLLTLEVIKDYPIIGIGFGLQTYGKLDLEKYQKKLPQKYQQKVIIADPHNIALDIAVRLGIIGLILFFYIIFVFFKVCLIIVKHGKDDFAKHWGRCLATAFFSFLFIGFFHPVFSHMPETILCIIFSMLTIIWHFNNDPISKDII